MEIGIISTNFEGSSIASMRQTGQRPSEWFHSALLVLFWPISSFGEWLRVKSSGHLSDQLHSIGAAVIHPMMTSAISFAEPLEVLSLQSGDVCHRDWHGTGLTLSREVAEQETRERRAPNHRGRKPTALNVVQETIERGGVRELIAPTRTRHREPCMVR